MVQKIGTKPWQGEAGTEETKGINWETMLLSGLAEIDGVFHST